MGDGSWKVKVVLVVGGFDVDGGAEARHVNKDVNININEIYQYIYKILYPCMPRGFISSVC